MLSLHPVDIVNGNGAPATEVDDQNSKANGRFTSSHRQHEHRENLAGKVAKKFLRFRKMPSTPMTNRMLLTTR